MFDQEVVTGLDAQLLNEGCLGVASHYNQDKTKGPVPIVGTGPF